MSSETYPPGTVRRLLDTDLVTTPTRAALRGRLEEETNGAPHFFDSEEYATLRCVCARLVPQTERAEPIDLAHCIDKRLAENTGDGWRYDSLPPDAETYQRGLRGLDESSRAIGAVDFVRLDEATQDEILRLVQRGEATGETWATLHPRRFFEELLAECVETYYSHPLAQEEIGYVGMADARGWKTTALNELDAHEPRPVKDAHIQTSETLDAVKH